MSPIFLLISLFFLILVSAFFSASETGMMALNRYRLRHLAEVKGYKIARLVRKLIVRPDRLLGVILIGSTFSNLCASSIVTLLAVTYFGPFGVAVSTVALTLVILIFSEIAPKTLAALYPQKVAFSVAIPLIILLKIFYPLVWASNAIANAVLFLFRVRLDNQGGEQLNSEELRTLIYEGHGNPPSKHQSMLLSLLNLEQISVDDIMVPKTDIVGIDIHADWKETLKQLSNCQHTRLLLYEENMNTAIGMLHARKILSLMTQNKLSKETLRSSVDEIHFIPEGTYLNTQLHNFQQNKIRAGLVVDEYGDIQGLVTLEDILEEIVGEFTTDFASATNDIIAEANGSYLVDAKISIRKLNRLMNWNFDTQGPKTLSGLIIDYLETIPRPNTSLSLNGYRIEIMKVQGNAIRTVRITI